jgi:hypothetical protein
MSGTDAPRLDRVALALYWGALAVGPGLPWALDVLFHGPGLGRRLFAPGYNVFLIGVLDAAPFAAYAVFALVHLGTANRRGAEVARRRLAGVAAAGLALLGAALWVHLSILTSRSSTAALGYLVLPLELLPVLPVGYAAGRLAAARLGRRPT